MKSILTDEQQKQLVKMALQNEESWDTIIMFGGDLYRQGIIRGMLYGVCFAGATVVGWHLDEIKEYVMNKINIINSKKEEL